MINWRLLPQKHYFLSLAAATYWSIVLSKHTADFKVILIFSCLKLFCFIQIVEPKRIYYISLITISLMPMVAFMTEGCKV